MRNTFTYYEFDLVINGVKWEVNPIYPAMLDQCLRAFRTIPGAVVSYQQMEGEYDMEEKKELADS